jgi:outer membrane protein OmpA-like peptidoglycan-associated protein
LPKPPVPPKITVAINAVQLDSNNVEQKGISLKIEDFISHNMRPLLTYIFFDENSDVIPSRYIRLSPEETKDFNLKKLQNYDALQTYYHVLNIIGKRLKQSDSKIKLIGTNSNQGEEKGNKDLSERRAIAVRNYLRDVWGISEDRIKIEARNLPKEASREDEKEGIEENRRVEILSDDWSITEPVITVDTVRKISKSTIRFLPDGNADAGILSWNLKAKEKNKELISFEGIGKLPTQLNWEIKDDDTSSPSRGGKIEYSFSITDSLGQTVATTPKQLSVEQLTIDMKRIEMIADREFEYYSLILFDFGSSKLGDEHKKVLDFVKSRITDKSIVTITGYTDKIGDEEVNLKLSTERAKSASTKLKIPNAIVKGVGESELLYDNTLPEGRFYCRTVKITIETPVEHNNNGQKKIE